MTWTLRLGGINRDLMIFQNRFQTVTGVDEVVQRIGIALRHFQGEYFLNTPGGVPWTQEVLGRKYAAGELSAVFRRAVLDVSGVVRIRRFVMGFDTATRDLEVTIDVDVQTPAGSIVTTTVTTTVADPTA